MSLDLKRGSAPTMADDDTLLSQDDASLEDADAIEATDAADGAPQPGGPLLRRINRRLLSLSLFYKLLIGNSAIVLLGALAGTFITLRVASARPGEQLDWPLAATFAICGVVLSAVLNALILRAALSPLEQLQEVVRQVRRGNLTVRAHPGPLADAEIAHIADTLNVMLDDVRDYEEQLRALSGSVIRAQEDERQRIARELHDDTGQVLTLLLIRLKLLENKPGADAIKSEVEELRALVSGAIDQVRRLALNLRPPTIDQLGLLPTLRSLVNTFGENTHIAVKLTLPKAHVIALSPERTLAVYRIVQEALTNAAKHASARHVSVDVAVDGGDLVATVRDDGQGFSPETYASTRASRNAQGQAGVGLFGMEERARLAGGRVRIQSAPGRGTSVTLRVPVDSVEHVEHVEHTEHDEHGEHAEPAYGHDGHDGYEHGNEHGHDGGQY